jgi:hypothetical protein
MHRGVQRAHCEMTRRVISTFQCGVVRDDVR